MACYWVLYKETYATSRKVCKYWWEVQNNWVWFMCLYGIFLYLVTVITLTEGESHSLSTQSLTSKFQSHSVILWGSQWVILPNEELQSRETERQNDERTTSTVIFTEIYSLVLYALEGELGICWHTMIQNHYEAIIIKCAN